MSKKPAALPDIEDATFAACLDPLAEALVAGAAEDAADRVANPDWPPPDPPRMARLGDPRSMPSAQGDLADPLEPYRLRNAVAGDGGIRPVAAPTPQALAEWRSLADQEFAEFCAIELFLAKSDAELSAAVAAYPRQVLGFLERITRLEDRRALQQQAMTELLARMQMALMQVETGPGLDLSHPVTAWGTLP